MERSISFSELSAENGAAVVNAYRSIIRDSDITAMIAQERFVDNCTSSQWKYRLLGLKFEKLI